MTIAAGSLIFCESPDFIGKAIRVAQALKWHSGTQWNHVAMAIETGVNPLVSQASVKGVTSSQRLSDLQGGKIEIISPPPFLNVDIALQFLQSQLDDDYGWFSLAVAAIDLMLPAAIRLDVRRDGTWICSALVAEAWRVGGWLHNWQSVYEVAPAQLYAAVTNRSLSHWPHI